MNLCAGYLYLLVLRQPGKPLCSVPGSDAQSAASLQNLSAHPSVKSVTAGDIEKSDESHKGCRSRCGLQSPLFWAVFVVCVPFHRLTVWCPVCVFLFTCHMSALN